MLSLSAPHLGLLNNELYIGKNTFKYRQKGPYMGPFLFCLVTSLKGLLDQFLQIHVVVAPGMLL